MITPKMGIDPRFIYIATDGEFFKVGITKDIYRRQLVLSSSFGKTVYIICIASASCGIAREVERKVLAKLKSFQYLYKYANIASVSIEWFDCDFEIIHNTFKPLCNEILLTSNT